MKLIHTLSHSEHYFEIVQNVGVCRLTATIITFCGHTPLALALRCQSGKHELSLFCLCWWGRPPTVKYKRYYINMMTKMILTIPSTITMYRYRPRPI